MPRRCWIGPLWPFPDLINASWWSTSINKPSLFGQETPTVGCAGLTKAESLKRLSWLSSSLPDRLHLWLHRGPARSQRGWLQALSLQVCRGVSTVISLTWDIKGSPKFQRLVLAQQKWKRQHINKCTSFHFSYFFGVHTGGRAKKKKRLIWNNEAL